MLSNLPPGVSLRDLPGCSREDDLWHDCMERAREAALEAWKDEGEWWDEKHIENEALKIFELEEDQRRYGYEDRDL